MISKSRAIPLSRGITFCDAVALPRPVLRPCDHRAVEKGRRIPYATNKGHPLEHELSRLEVGTADVAAELDFVWLFLVAQWPRVERVGTRW